MTRSAENTKTKADEVSVLCRNCTKLKECLKDRSKTLFMAYRTYCSTFDNKDKSPRLFPFLQPYEVEALDAEYIYNQSSKGKKWKTLKQEM